MHAARTTRFAFLIGIAAAAGCAGGGGVGAPAPEGDSGEISHESGPSLASAPWSGPALGSSAVPSVYVEAWSAAENRETCALLAPVSVEEAAAPRRATFSGGWAVAYDMAELRSAFGVAGTGASAAGDMYDGWPYRIEWADGSVAEYGPEGGTGPNQLAYLTIPGQACLYNVWSRLGADHLEKLLGRLRFVR